MCAIRATITNSNLLGSKRSKDHFIATCQSQIYIEGNQFVEKCV